jgi:hypothetical protein
MPFLANVLKVMIASPGDLTQERRIVTEEIDGWNVVNASTRRLVLLPVKWETHSTPEYGAHPQTIINRQLLEDADIVVAVFGTRIGTPTKEHVSGTVEEIKRHVVAGKTAKIYFSDVPVSPSLIDQEQYASVQEFKKECRESGLYAGYDSLDQFRRDFKRHLELELNHPKYLWLPLPERGGRAQEDPISEDALRLLRAAKSGDDGAVTHRQGIDGDAIYAGNQKFTDDSRRSTAKWKAVVDDLVKRGALEHDGDSLYPVTEYGYNLIDQAEARQRASEPTNVALNISGPPDKQVLLVRSNRSLSLKQLDFLTSTDACICSQSLSQEGTDINVKIDYAKIFELYDAPRSEVNPMYLSGPVKLRLLFFVGGLNKQATLPAMLAPKMVNNTQWQALTGAATFDV